MRSRNPDHASRDIVRLLRALATLIESSDLGEAAVILEKQAALSKGKRRAPSDENRLPLNLKAPASRDLPALAVTLHTLSSRDEGRAFLSSASLTRRELEELGRILKTPVLKTDNVERLIEKIIEESIGSRLSSEAIRGEHTK